MFPNVPAPFKNWVSQLSADGTYGCVSSWPGWEVGGWGKYLPKAADRAHCWGVRRIRHLPHQPRGCQTLRCRHLEIESDSGLATKGGEGGGGAHSCLPRSWEAGLGRAGKLWSPPVNPVWPSDNDIALQGGAREAGTSCFAETQRQA